MPPHRGCQGPGMASLERLAIVGAGPHGHEIAWVLDGYHPVLLDDDLPGFRSSGWLLNHDLPYVAGACWPRVKQEIATKVNAQPWHGGRVVFPGAHVSPEATL